MKKVLFLIHDLGPGGAEKVLVNLVNNMSYNKFDVTVMTIFDEGINKQFLNDKIRYLTCFSKMIPGNSHLMKMFSPKQLHRYFIKEHYDIEIAYLEGPCARIISGCPCEDTKLVSWIHTEHQEKGKITVPFRSYNEAQQCYNRFDKIVCVSETVENDFSSLVKLNVPTCVLYNTNEYNEIIIKSKEKIEKDLFDASAFNMIGVGKLLENKGFDRVLGIVQQLKNEGFNLHYYILGTGPEEAKLKKYVKDHDLTRQVNFLGYQTNPYKYMARSDLFVCSSYREGFSTATTEALIVGTAVCTTNVSGMKEMLGENNEYGIITENTNTALLNGIRKLISDQQLLKYYSAKAFERGKAFSTENTVHAVEDMLVKL